MGKAFETFFRIIKAEASVEIPEWKIEDLAIATFVQRRQPLSIEQTVHCVYSVINVIQKCTVLIPNHVFFL